MQVGARRLGGLSGTGLALSCALLALCSCGQGQRHVSSASRHTASDDAVDLGPLRPCDESAQGDAPSDFLVLDGSRAVGLASRGRFVELRSRSGSAFARVGLAYDVSDGSGALHYVRADGALAPVEVVFAERTARVGRVALETPATALRLFLAGGELTFVYADFYPESTPCSRPSPLWPSEAELLPVAPKLAPLESIEAMTHPQSDWSTRDTGVCGALHTPKIFTVHHTETPTFDPLKPEERLRQIQAFHIETRGWCDIGYHFLISADGELWHGRKTETRTGAHVADHNTGNLGIAFLGSFQTEVVPDVMVERAAALLRALSETYGVPLIVSKVLGHRQWPGSNTTCPGDQLLLRFPELIDAELDGDGDGTAQSGDCDDDNPNAWIQCQSCVDHDRDGFYAGCDRYLSVNGPDCDDGDPRHSPVSPEVLDDGIDQNCDGVDSTSCFTDVDGDGFGSSEPLAPQSGGCAFAGASSNATDCDDSAAGVHPGALEFCDEVDSDCDGTYADRFADADRDDLPDCVDTSFDVPTLDPGIPPDDTEEPEGRDAGGDSGCGATSGSALAVVLLLLVRLVQRTMTSHE